MGSGSVLDAFGCPEIVEYHRVPNYTDPSGIACWWDTEPFDHNHPCHFPVRISDTRLRALNPTKRFDQINGPSLEVVTEGIFCSWNCALAYGRAHDDLVVRERADANMMAYILRCQWQGFSAKERREIVQEGKLPFKAAIRPQVALEKFGGHMTIERYRSFFSDGRHFVYVHPEYTKVVPSQFGVFIEDLDRLIFKPRSIKETYLDKQEVFDRDNAVKYSKLGLAKDHLIPRTSKKDFRVCAVEDVDTEKPDGRTFVRAMQFSVKLGGVKPAPAMRPVTEKRRADCTKPPRKRNKGR